jgi:hypothetical protein
VSIGLKDTLKIDLTATFGRTKISMKMARPDKPKPAADDSSEDESMSSGTESEDEDMEDEEGSTDAPDMYRNSSLGM